MENLLKGNFKTKKKVLNKDNNQKKDDYKQRALNSIGGSMVFVERDLLFWNDKENKDKI